MRARLVGRSAPPQSLAFCLRREMEPSVCAGFVVVQCLAGCIIGNGMFEQAAVSFDGQVRLGVGIEDWD